MNKILPTLCIMALAVTACQARTEPAAEQPTLSEQLEVLEKQEAVIVSADGPAEQLLHKMGLPESTKSTFFVLLDEQLKALEQSGEMQRANSIRSTRPMLEKAMDENMALLIEEAAAVYSTEFTEGEIDRLRLLHSDPAMKKLVKKQLELNQKILPITDEWGELVTKRYQELVAEQIAISSTSEIQSNE